MGIKAVTARTLHGSLHFFPSTKPWAGPTRYPPLTDVSLQKNHLSHHTDLLSSSRKGERWVEFTRFHGQEVDDLAPHRFGVAGLSGNAGLHWYVLFSLGLDALLTQFSSSRCDSAEPYCIRLQCPCPTGVHRHCLPPYFHRLSPRLWSTCRRFRPSVRTPGRPSILHDRKRSQHWGSKYANGAGGPRNCGRWCSRAVSGMLHLLIGVLFYNVCLRSSESSPLTLAPSRQATGNRPCCSSCTPSDSPLAL